MTASPLSVLVSIISSHVSELESVYSSANAHIPSLSDPFIPGPIDANQAAAQAKAIIVAAAAQLIATVQSPVEYLQNTAPAMYVVSSLGIAEDLNIADILAEGGPEGVHVDDVATAAHSDPSYLARVLRFLATRHIFKEVSPNVFTNNRISLLLKKTKPVKELQADPITRYEGAPLAGFVSHFAGEGLKGSWYIKDFIRDRDSANAPFNIAFNTPLKSWEFQQLPGNEALAHRFTAIMKGQIDLLPKEIVTKGFNWASLKRGSTVVDIGGSIGVATHCILKENPGLKHVVQDLEGQIKAAEGWWEENEPEAVKSGQVILQTHDFFNPQPVKGAAVYFLRVVIHDWPDKSAITILKNLRDVAASNTKLIIFDNRVSYTCYDPARPENKVPKPLLSNLGIGGSGFASNLDMHMLTMFDAKERTAQEFKELGLKAGWNLEEITSQQMKLNGFVYVPV